jgi:hypothetical protein
MCRQAERDHESKKLVVLMERVKKQIAERQNRGVIGEPSAAAVKVMSPDAGRLRLPSRSVPFER